jgi:hypothetical protein
VSVWANWYELLRDYRLIVDDEISAETWKKRTTPCIEFSVLQPSRQDDDDLPGLIYWDDHKKFVTDVDFSIRIPGLSCDGHSPELYFREGLPDLKLGLRVLTSWWEQMCKNGELKELARTETYTDHESGWTELVVVTLPHSEFRFYYHKPDTKHLKRLAKQNELRDRQLVQNGWKREEFDEIGSPACLKHKYFTVWHNAI